MRNADSTQIKYSATTMPPTSTTANSVVHKASRFSMMWRALAVAIEQESQQEKARATRHNRQNDEQAEIVTGKARRDRHDLVGDRRQPLDQDDPGAPLRVSRAEGFDLVAVAVEMDQPGARPSHKAARRWRSRRCRRRPRPACTRRRAGRPGRAAPATSAPASRRAGSERRSFRQRPPRSRSQAHAACRRRRRTSHTDGEAKNAARQPQLSSERSS